MGRCNPPDFSQSCLVAAHPDDEVLWFSSILTQVERVILCFEDCDEYPLLGPARRAVLREYPLVHMQALALSEPCSVHLVDWAEPEQSNFGLRLNRQGTTDDSQQRYRKSFEALREVLGVKLAGMKVVFTHNPWGEYGHADHAQVSAVIESLRGELGFRSFYSGYAAPRTLPLAASALGRIGSWFELATQPGLSKQLQALYQKHDCWTWPAEYSQFDRETFFEVSEAPAAPGSGFRMNCVTP
jgi:LmbE family N-acetylglucosaminyl deacetylase